VLDAASRVVGRPIPVRTGPRRPGDPPVLVASADRAEKVLAWRPEQSTLGQMLDSAWAWRQRHPRGYGS
jgi:UDP-glucose 4-epimerase